MLGAISGDIIGSVYEWNNIKTTMFQMFSDSSRFTDDTVMTVAMADSILSGKNCSETMRNYYNRYPEAGYGSMFKKWATSANPTPYDSWGNGAAMRISPVAYACNKLDDVLPMAEKYTAITHNHPEGIKGAQATATAIFLAKDCKNKGVIKEYIEQNFGYNLSKSCDDIRPDYKFDASCQGTVPEAITAFLESTDFESSIRLAVSLGGDTDTIACITGSIAEAYYSGVPDWIARETLARLDHNLQAVISLFRNRFMSDRIEYSK
jgi:ADP-ribosylglycohydrolase